MGQAFAALAATGQSALTVDLLRTVECYNRATGRTMVVPSEYLDVVITRQ